MSSLFVHLPAAPVTAATEFAYVLSVDGRIPGAASSAPASLLPAAQGAGSEVVALVPADALSWHRIEWPRGLTPASPRLRAALEGLLEERLLDDPETLHFAVEPHVRAGEPAWVAACDRVWLRSCLDVLDAAGRTVTRIVPEVAPEAPPALMAMGEPEHAILLSRSPQGVRVLPLAAASMALLPPVTDDLLCVAEPGTATQAEALLQRPLVLQPAAQRWLLAAQSGWNLAQFEFARSARARAIKRLATAGADWLRAPRWRPARWGVLALVAANLVGLHAGAWEERAMLEAKREEMRRILTTTFPQVKVVIDAPAQMAREVAALGQATGTATPADLEVLLGALAAAAPGRVAGGLEYARGSLRVRGLGWTTGDLRRAEPALRARGLGATLEGSDLVLRSGGDA